MSEYVAPDQVTDIEYSPVSASDSYAEALSSLGSSAAFATTFDVPGIGSGRAQMSWFARFLNDFLRTPEYVAKAAIGVVDAIIDGSWDVVGASLLGFGVGFGLGWTTAWAGKWAWSSALSLQGSIWSAIGTTVGIQAVGILVSNAAIVGQSEDFQTYFREGRSYGGYAGAAAFGAYAVYRRLPDVRSFGEGVVEGVGDAGMSPFTAGKAAGEALRAAADWLSTSGLFGTGLGPVFW